jgi:hypothetical protein
MALMIPGLFLLPTSWTRVLRDLHEPAAGRDSFSSRCGRAQGYGRDRDVPDAGRNWFERVDMLDNKVGQTKKDGPATWRRAGFDVRERLLTPSETSET